MAQMWMLIETMTEIPWLIVMTIGGIVSISRYQSNPARYGRILIAIGLAIGGTYGGRVFSQVAWRVLSQLVDDLPDNPRKLQVISILVELPSSICYAVAWGFMFAAAFGKDSAPRSRYLIEEGAEA